MHNQELFKRICESTCTFAELESFKTSIDEKEYDLDNSFEKYYDIKNIVGAIEKYEKGQIDAKYLAYWANAYNWIIMATLFNQSDENKGIASFNEYLVWEISDCLDSLSFFDVNDEFVDTNIYRTPLEIYDEIYKNSDCWETVFAVMDEAYDNEEDFDEDISFLSVNAAKKTFVRFEYASLDYRNNQVPEKRISVNEWDETIDVLLQNGYTELKLGDWDE